MVSCASRPVAAQNPVVIELFTSEGCSSCPPADALLVELSRQQPVKGAELILLGEHVDYWNYIGWTDRFSSAQFSQRQSEYAKTFHLASVYTPQMVIDGREQFVGNDPGEVQRKIQAAAAQTKPIHVTAQWQGKNLHVAVSSAATGKARVLLALTEDGLSTTVGGGENGGRTLHHAAVVRQLRELGTVDRNRFEQDIELSPEKGWNIAQMKIAILVQDSATGRIEGAAALGFAH